MLSPPPALQTTIDRAKAPPTYEGCARAMMRSLLAELLHEEEALVTRTRRDADRYDGVELDAPFYAIATHAEATLMRLDVLATARNMGRKRASRLVKCLLACASELYRERFVSAERAYRSTVSTLRSGMDLVRLARSAADVAGDAELTDFCEEWLSRRGALVENLSEQLDWFADRPRVSMETSHGIAGARRRLAFPRRNTHGAPTTQRAPLRGVDSYLRLVRGSNNPFGAAASNMP